MINTSRNRLQNALLTLNFLNANENEITEVERHRVIKFGLIQLIYLKCTEWKQGHMTC